MKVVIITTSEPRENRGLSVVSLNQAIGLMERGCEVSIFCRGEEQKTQYFNGVQINTFRYRTVNNSIRNYFRTKNQATSAWRYFYSGNEPDVIHGHDYLIYSSIINIVPRYVRTIFTVHDPLVYHQKMITGDNLGTIKEYFFTRLEKQVLERSDCIHYISKYTLNRFAYNSPRIRRKSVLVENWVDYNRFVVPTNKIMTRRKVGVADDEFLIFTLRALEPRMGLDRLMEAFNLLRKKVGHKLRLIIGGKGPMLAVLKKLQQDFNIENVEFLGYVPDSDVVKWYQAADVVVIPSLDGEGFGLPILEAMSCGTPVLGTPNCAIPEILSGNRRGLFKGDTVEDLLEGLMDFYCSYLEGKTPPMNEQRSYVLNKYSKEMILDKILRTYTSP